MNQIMKKTLLMFCMAVCILSLVACSRKENASAEQIPQEIENTMKSGAFAYLSRLDNYDDAAIDSELKRVEKQKNEVMVLALNSWKEVKGDLGKMAAGTGAVLSQEVTRVGDDGYRVVARISYEKKEMDFTLSAKEVIKSNGQIVLIPTELVFSPCYTTGEKLSKAGINSFLGIVAILGAVILMGFFINKLKGINNSEDKKKDEQAASERGAAAPIPADPISAPEVVPVALMQAQTAVPENLADDMELAAVITAAIAAAQRVPVEGLVVRSIRRKPGSNWKNA